MQTGVDSPHRASKLAPISRGICFSSILVCAFVVLAMRGSEFWVLILEEGDGWIIA